MRNIAYNPAYMRSPIVVDQCGGAQDLIEDKHMYAHTAEIISIDRELAELLRLHGMRDLSRISPGELLRYKTSRIVDPHGEDLDDKLDWTHDEAEEHADKYHPVISEEHTTRREMKEEKNEPMFWSKRESRREREARSAAGMVLGA